MEDKRVSGTVDLTELIQEQIDRALSAHHKGERQEWFHAVQGLEDLLSYYHTGDFEEAMEDQWDDWEDLTTKDADASGVDKREAIRAMFRSLMNLLGDRDMLPGPRAEDREG